MTTEDDSALRKKVEGEFPENAVNVGKLVKTLIRSFLKSDSNYGAITDIKTDVDSIYGMVRDVIDEEKLDVYALKLDDRVLLSRTGVDFEGIYEVIKGHSELQIKKDMIEIWDDEKNRILHLIVVPVRKHFPIEYSSVKEKAKMIERISSMTWQVS
jgi:hypothetical protein